MFSITCHYHEHQTPVFEESIVVEHLYRIAQESINNAVRHGRATEISISLHGDEHLVRLIITDNGEGFPDNWQHSDGMGVRIMQFRARLVGASIEIHSTSEAGATVTCTLPANSVPFYLQN